MGGLVWGWGSIAGLLLADSSPEKSPSGQEYKEQGKYQLQYQEAAACYRQAIVHLALQWVGGKTGWGRVRRKQWQGGYISLGFRPPNLVLRKHAQVTALASLLPPYTARLPFGILPHIQVASLVSCLGSQPVTPA